MRGSLRLRLAVWCAGIIFSVVLMIALYGYAVVSRTQYDELDGRLQNVAEHVSTELARAPDASERAHVLSGAHRLGVAIALYDSTGTPLSGETPATFDPLRIMTSSPHASYGLLAALAPAVHPVSHGRGALGLVGRAHERCRVYVLPADGLIAAGGRVRYVVGFASLAALDRSLRRVLMLMLWIVVIGNVLTFTTGWMLAGRALQPVRLLTEAAGSIARSGVFSQRVTSDMPRDELGRLATTFNEMLERLERAHVAQARFIADASHELRAPITVVQANLELLEFQLALSQSERHDAVQEAHIEAARLGRLVADLLLLARADAGVPKRHVPVDLDRVVMDVLGEVHHLAARDRIRIGEFDSIVVAGDADQLKQLLLNLLENAIRYTPANGAITVALRRVGAYAEAEIRDAGIGILAEDLPRVFERFFRADRARTRNAGGTGLGLSIAQWIAWQHDGVITLASEPGRGTLATVRIPAAH
jgi:two-component system OmpR family sensor kinase